MKVTIKIMGPAKRKTSENPATVDIPESSRIIDLMLNLGYTDTEARYLTYVLKGETVRPTAVLSEGDEIQAVLQMGGG